MPNPRRRKFSVHNDINKESSKNRNGFESSHPEASDLKVIIHKEIPTKTRSKSKIFTHGTKPPHKYVIFNMLESSTSISPKRTVEPQLSTTDHITHTTSSSTFDLPTIVTNNNQVNQAVDEQIVVTEQNPKTEEKPQDENRGKFPRKHKIKVRSPRRLIILQQGKEPVMTNRSVGTIPINWSQEVAVCHLEARPSVPTAVDEERQSNHSFDDMCRICHGGESMSLEVGPLISACACRGTVGRVHVKCLERWLTESGKSRCELCGTRYATKRVHRYGVPRALIMWILSQNAKQLMVDSLGIMLMSPLAVLAAWLSGRTLAGLMAQESHVTPWPLASTFVLACMTLVCYYCWIVSAATRHALGWWIWYRSQYEVRLELQQDAEE